MNNKLFNGEWQLIEKINSGKFSTVYKAKKSDGQICAIKHISLPKSKDEMDEIIRKGLAKDYQSANNYFINVFNNEINILKRFNNNPYIVDFYDFCYINRNDGTGADYYIRMEYVEDIKDYYSKTLIDINDVVKLGMDICTSIGLCSSVGVIHGDIKPENVFIGNDNNYKLGDFSASLEMDKDSASQFGTLNYIAPEVYQGKKSSVNSDLYSLGVLMYQLISGNLPFMNDKIDEKKAFDIRMSGKKIPPIPGVNKKLMNIILKACEFNEKERYKTASEMHEALLTIQLVNSKKHKVAFSSNNELADTIDINDPSLLSQDDSRSYRKERVSFKTKNMFKMAIAVLIIVSLLSFGGVTYAFNRTCKAGYINKNGRCVKGYYYCNSGYVLNSDNKCQKTIESSDAKVTYNCPKGYILNGEYCVSEEVKEISFVYKCADGFTFNSKNNTCSKQISIDAQPSYSVSVDDLDAEVYYECEDSSYKLSGNKCTKKTSNSISAEYKYVCNGGGILNGSVCEYITNPDWGYRCSKGNFSYSDYRCHYYETANLTYVCPTGMTLSGKKCISESTDVKEALKKYSCPTGYEVVESKCVKISGNTKYICPDGATLSGKKCFVTETTAAVGVYDCPTGYIPSGMVCVEENLPVPVKKYSCSKVYTLNGDQCEKYEIVASKKHYD